MACEILEVMADGLKIQPRNVLSKLLMDEQSDSVFRLNHYPPRPDRISNLIGFGEHTDPQIISVLRSNNTSGLQISLREGSWISVPPDEDSFFINVGDSLQVISYYFVPYLLLLLKFGVGRFLMILLGWHWRMQNAGTDQWEVQKCEA